MATSLIPMSLSASPDPAAGLDLGSPVPLAAIPRSLKQLWESSAAVTRASAMNFAICSEDGSSLGPNTELIREVTREHACRAILMGVIANSLMKAGIATVVGERRFAWQTAASLLAMAAAGAAMLAL